MISRRAKRNAGFVLLTTALSLVALIGMLGVAVDIGRIFITKSEVQTFTDLTAIAGARELDGSDTGVTRARQQVSSSQMKWNFATTSSTQNTVLISSNGTTWNDGSIDVKHPK